VFHVMLLSLQKCVKCLRAIPINFPSTVQKIQNRSREEDEYSKEYIDN
jgi:hypothetical protein